MKRWTWFCVCASALALGCDDDGGDEAPAVDAAISVDVAATQQDSAVEQDMAVVEQDSAVVEQDMMVVEQDMTVVEQDSAVIEQDMAVVEQDSAVVEQDSAVVEQDSAVVEQDAAVVPSDYRYVLIYDATWLADVPGIAGVDVCEVTIHCQGEVIPAASATLRLGDGLVCTPERAEHEDYPTACADGVDRGDADVTIDERLSCFGPGETSGYTSIGLGGILEIAYDRDVRGCDISVEESVELGEGEEQYQIYICGAPDAPRADCEVVLGVFAGSVEATLPSP